MFNRQQVWAKVSRRLERACRTYNGAIVSVSLDGNGLAIMGSVENVRAAVRALKRLGYSLLCMLSDHRTQAATATMESSSKGIKATVLA